ncbi:MAG: hypothetical protein HKP12_16510, partial [Gammaproteobacteria bacterium]|nr:hypothetical protein [Gammaproteobacteria bacterium]
GDEGQGTGSLRCPATKQCQAMASGHQHHRLLEGAVMACLERKIYVAFNNGPWLSRGRLNIRQHISAENTYPRICWIQHILGFTHYVTRSRKGRFVVGRKTEGKRLRNKLKQLNVKLRKMRTEGGRAMVAYLRRHLRGHIQYYGVSGNSRIVARYVYYATFYLFKWLNRRSQRSSLTWKRFGAVVRPLLPQARLVHDLYPKPQWMTQAGSRMV